MNLLLRWLAMTAVSIAVAMCCYGCGRALDCSHGQVDGQCGIGTGMGEASGLFLGGAIFISATIYYGSAALRARASNAEEDKS
jgi:hypothetical protein